MRLLWLAVFGVVLCGPVSASERWQPDGDMCGDKTNTVEIAGCLAARAQVWDGRLNQAYKALQAMLNAGAQEQLAKLTAAQRLWVHYREANCAYYASEQGTIRQIDTAECVRRMTQDRAIELQQAGPN